MAIEHRYYDSFDTVGYDVSICDWQTANQLTDHQLVPCTNKATHFFVDEAGDKHLLCLAHADLYRTIMEEMPEKISQVVED